MGRYNYQEKKKARKIFKQLKAGLKEFDDLSSEERRLVLRYYGWLIWKSGR